MKKQIKDLKCRDLECSNCPFCNECEWVSIVDLSFGENFKNFITEIELKLGEKMEVEENENQESQY